MHTKTCLAAIAIWSALERTVLFAHESTRRSRGEHGALQTVLVLYREVLRAGGVGVVGLALTFIQCRACDAVAC
jgi:hypothetical protein